MIGCNVGRARIHPDGGSAATQECRWRSLTRRIPVRDELVMKLSAQPAGTRSAASRPAARGAKFAWANVWAAAPKIPTMGAAAEPALLAVPVTAEAKRDSSFVRAPSRGACETH